MLAVGRKEFRQVSRDRRSLLVLLFVPACFLLLYGYALNFDVLNIQLAVQDNDRTPAEISWPRSSIPDTSSWSGKCPTAASMKR